MTGTGLSNGESKAVHRSGSRLEHLLDQFKPAPFVAPLRDQDQIPSLYRYWRIRIFYSIFIGYALYYFTRYSLTFAQPGLMTELAINKKELGLLASLFSITYGLSKFVSGVFSDRSNPRYFMAFGLFITGIINILFGFSSSLLLFSLLWALNGWFQGFGWPPCARCLMHWYSHSERGAWWSTWNISHNLGAFVIPWVVSYAISYWQDWRYAMFVPGVIAIFGSFFLVNRMRDTPQSLGLPPIEEFRAEPIDKNELIEEEKEPSSYELLVSYVLTNQYIWLLALAYFFVYLARMGVNQWTALYLIEKKGYGITSANGIVSLFEVGGLLGALSAGWSSDRFFKARRGPVNALGALGMIGATFLFWSVPAGHPLLDTFAVLLLGFTIFVPQMLIGVAAAELSHKKAAATATGFIGFFAYLGAASAGFPLGWIIQESSWEWNGFLLALLLSSTITLLALLPLWNVTHRKRGTTT